MARVVLCPGGMSTSCDLRRCYGPRAASLPATDDPDEEELVAFHRGNLPAPPPELRTDRIAVKKGWHGYGGSYLVENAWVFLSRPAARELGTFLLACLFHGPPHDVWLRLDDPTSEIRQLCIPAYSLDVPPEELPFLVPGALRYHATQPDKYPWMHDHVDPGELPNVALTNAEDMVVTEEERRNRDTLRLESGYEGMRRLGTLLLDAGHPHFPGDRYALESEAGFRGVGPASIEITFILDDDRADDELRSALR
jgi:hypothetical protein